MYVPGMIGLFVLGLMIGRAYQKWADGLWDYEEEVYEEGYEEGVRAGREEGWNVAIRQRAR